MCLETDNLDIHILFFNKEIKTDSACGKIIRPNSALRNYWSLGRDPKLVDTMLL